MENKGSDINNKFILTFIGELEKRSWVVYSTSKPTFKFNDNGDKIIEPITLSFNDPEQSEIQYIMKWVSVYTESIIVRKNNSVNHEKLIELEMLDLNDIVIEKWFLNGTTLTNVSFGDPSIFDTDITQITFILQPTDIKLMENKEQPLKLIPLPYEPKRNHRFTLDFPKETGLESWWVLKTSRPTVIYSELHDSNIVKPILITFRDPIGPSATQAIYNLFASKKEFDYNIQMLDPTGEIIEEWEVKKCEIIEVSFGDLSMDDDNITTINVLIQPSYVKLKNT